MTSIDFRANHSETENRPPDGQLRKATLYCPVCGHQSPTDGNWDVETVESQQEFHCPECDQVVAVR